MRPVKHILFALLACCFQAVYPQTSPPCGNDYGSSADETAIASAMRYGTVTDAQNALFQAWNTRGTSLGCQQLALSYLPPDTTRPALSAVESVWLGTHAPAVSGFSRSCPRIGRYENNSALGAYYAWQAGYFQDTLVLASIGDLMYDQQYATWNVATPDPRHEGVFGYLHVPATDPCYPGGVVGTSVDALCSALPAYCVTWSNGGFAGMEFAVAGQDDASGWHDGGLAYDHGWVGVQMIEASLAQSNPQMRARFRSSALLAGQYALAEHCVRNHNYTAKLIWLLAELYGLTGDSLYRDELNYKLEKNLLPGILWDGNNDGYVDGTTPPIAFSDLTPAAQSPGRMWDGHNSLPWYHAMNAWALVEAYVAFRDRQDSVRAGQLQPFAIGMLDNLAAEVLQQGVVSPNVLGIRDMAYALLLGIWKVAHYENAPHPDWEQAVWALWNAGYFNAYSTHSVCVGMYLLVRSGTPYVPLADRDQVLQAAETSSGPPLVEVAPNPTGGLVRISFRETPGAEIDYRLLDAGGGEVAYGHFQSREWTLDLGGLPAGLYFLQLLSQDGRLTVRKLVRY